MKSTKNSPTQTKKWGKKRFEQDHNNSIAAQCNRLIVRLRQGPCTTVQLRHEEDILGVGPRVYDLRHKYGYNIKTFWTDDFNPGGGRHRVAKYVLMPGQWQQRGNQ